ncbi:hypothetical protein SEA_REDRAIDER77_14 [Mycobacterium phage RedRaider77]|uniref:Uncharacterized protein n=1 Tax=Mycobacterium phage RedRaider77 TaxID=2500794 RepID=A0A411AY93_9CAUD|nr:hypothetical protein SEA_REDRAIDER77_14 [Mycobacterium phage RedRaider77]
MLMCARCRQPLQEDGGGFFFCNTETCLDND